MGKQVKIGQTVLRERNVDQDEHVELFIEESKLRLVIATYLLGQMMETPASNGAEVSAKERKVKAAFEYADLLLKG